MPTASPAMKLASTMLEAQRPLPSATPATRNHRVSNNSPAAPEKKNITHSSDANRTSSSRSSARHHRGSEVGDGYPAQRPIAHVQIAASIE